MIKQFPLQAVDGAQVVPVMGGDLGFRELFISFAIAPSGGVVTVEEQHVGSGAWVAVNRGTNLDITGGPVTLFSDTPIGAIRVTFAGLVGGTAPTLWMASQPTAMPPFGLVTDGGTGPSARYRVDIGQTGFFAGREFRTFREFNIAAGATLVLKIVVPINAILLEQSIEIDDGSIRITNASGGTPGGTFSEILPVIAKNNMSERPTPLYTPQITFAAGGTHTGGFIFDVHRAVAASATAQESTVGRTVGDERGIAPNTYYVRYENFGSGAATGTFWFIWEERPNGSQLPFP